MSGYTLLLQQHNEELDSVIERMAILRTALDWETHPEIITHLNREINTLIQRQADLLAEINAIEAWGNV